MKIQHLHIDGFGRLTNLDLALSPGFNIFFGPNEVGKSTLQQAVFVLLYGFFSGKHMTLHETEVFERFRPWYGSAYGGQLVYQLDGGQSFQVRRSFVGQHLRLSIVDAETGKELSHAFSRDGLGSLDFPLAHFGLPRDVFANTFLICQSDLRPLTNSAHEEISETIESTEAGSRDRRVMRAQQVLESALMEDVGTELTKSGPLAAAQERLQNLYAEKAVVLYKYQSLEADFVTQSQLKRNLQTLTGERDEYNYLLALMQSSALNFRINEIEKLLLEEANLREELDRLHAVADFPLNVRDHVERYAEERRTHLERLARLEGMAIPSRAQVDELQNAVAKLREQKLGLEPARDVPLEHEKTVRELEHILPETVRAYQKAEEELAELEQAIAAAEPLRAAVQRRRGLITTGPEKIHDLRLKWEAARKQLAEAESEHARVEAAWQAQGLSADAYERLVRRAAAVDPALIEDLKNKQAAADHLKQLAATNWKVRLLRPLAFAGFVLAVIGLTLIVLTWLDVYTNWLIEGIVFVLAALVTDGLAGLVLWRMKRAERKVDQAYQVVNQRVSGKGFTSVEELEATYNRYQQARPLYEAWQTSQETLAQSRKAGEALEAELLSVLELRAGTPLSAERILEIEQEARQLSKDLQALEKLDQQKAQLEETAKMRREALKKVVEQTRAILKAAGIVELNLLVDLRSFLVLCENRRALEKVEAQLSELEAKLAAKLEATLSVESEARAERAALIDKEAQLRHLLERAGLVAHDLDEALKEFRNRYEQAERYTRIQEILQSLEREHRALLRSQSLDQLKEQRVAFAQDMKALLALYPDFASMTSDQPEETLEASLLEVQRRIITTTNDLAAVEARLQSGTAEQRSLAEVEEEISDVRDTVERLTLHEQAINLALENLMAAAEDYHRNFLPRLNHALSRSLEFVSAGRYRRVHIQRGDLSVRVEAPELHQFVAPDHLSQSVQEEIYLLLRLGLAEAISEGRERLPLLLDDPLVNYDREHLLQALNYLATLAERNQLLLFTKDDFTAQWFKDRPADADRHQLHEL